MQSVLAEHLIGCLLLPLELLLLAFKVVPDLIDVAIDILFNKLSKMLPSLFV